MRRAARRANGEACLRHRQQQYATGGGHSDADERLFQHIVSFELVGWDTGPILVCLQHDVLLPSAQEPISPDRAPDGSFKMQLRGSNLFMRSDDIRQFFAVNLDRSHRFKPLLSQHVRVSIAR
jgi:hypothetical protein